MIEAGDDAGTEFESGDVLPEVVTQPAVPIPLNELQPWHRPRKQYVRRRQWVLRALRLVEHLKERPPRHGDRREIRYLTLPGVDFFDVRMLAELCSEQDVDLFSLGFLAGKEGNPVVARARVREEALIRAGHITDRSFTLPYRLEEITAHGSQAYREVVKNAPYDIINVDACGSMALPTKDNQSARIIDAIHRLIELQLSRTMERWLLFITTDVRRETLSEGVIYAFLDAIRENASASPEFAAQAAACLGAPESDIEAALEGAGETDLGFLRLCVLGLSKWMLHNAKEKRWEIKVHDAMCYSTTAEGDDRLSMPSLAFEFIPPAPGLRDRYDAVNIEPIPGGGHEDYSLRAVQKCTAMENLDEKLSNDNELSAELKEATRELLEEAGYSHEAIEALQYL